MTGYVVPVNVINHFLKSVEKDVTKNQAAQYKVCSLGINIQSLESKSLRRHYKLRDHQTGVLVININPQSPCKQSLQAGDIIMSIDGIKVCC